VTESLSQTSDAEILASIRWPREEQLPDDMLQWLIAPLGTDHKPLDNWPLGKGVAALMIEEADEMLKSMINDNDEIARQAITNGFIKIATILSSRIDTVPEESGTGEQTYPPANVFLDIILQEQNLSLAERLGLIEGTRRFMEIQRQVISYKATKSQPANFSLAEIAA
jgi:hypothetical protein